MAVAGRSGGGEAGFDIFPVLLEAFRMSLMGDFLVPP